MSPSLKKVCVVEMLAVSIVYKVQGGLAVVSGDQGVLHPQFCACLRSENKEMNGSGSR